MISSMAYSDLLLLLQPSSAPSPQLSHRMQQQMQQHAHKLSVMAHTGDIANPPEGSFQPTGANRQFLHSFKHTSCQVAASHGALSTENATLSQHCQAQVMEHQLCTSSLWWRAEGSGGLLLRFLLTDFECQKKNKAVCSLF